MFLRSASGFIDIKMAKVFFSSSSSLKNEFQSLIKIDISLVVTLNSDIQNNVTHIYGKL